MFHGSNGLYVLHSPKERAESHGATSMQRLVPRPLNHSEHRYQVDARCGQFNPVLLVNPADDVLVPRNLARSI